MSIFSFISDAVSKNEHSTQVIIEPRVTRQVNPQGFRNLAMTGVLAGLMTFNAVAKPLVGASLEPAETHHSVVKLAPNGTVRSIHLIHTESGKEVSTAYPYGLPSRLDGEDAIEVKISPRNLGSFVKGIPSPGQVDSPPSGYATGLPIGWNQSTGATSGQCFNYTIDTPSGHVNQISFTSQDSASSTSEQIKLSATISGGYGAFKVSDNFSYSDNYQSSANSGNQYFNLYSLYTLDSSVDPTNPLRSQGKDAGTSFNTLCGTQYMASVPVGMVATISIGYGSTSASTATNVSNTFKASYGLNTITNAVDTANSSTGTSSYFTFRMMIYGGGPDAAALLNDAFAMTDPTTGIAYYAACGGVGRKAPDSSACAKFVSNMGTGATQAMDKFNAQVASLESAQNPDLGFLERFPNGVAGAINVPPMVPVNIPSTAPAVDDILKPYKSQLQKYLNLLNQISTLNNRVVVLRDAVSQGRFNPSTLLDIQSYLNRLYDIYTPDRKLLVGNMDTCLNATSNSVKTDCEPIISNTVSNAYEWYSSGQPGDNFYAQQNTLALQYVGAFNPNAPNGTTVSSLDVIYIDHLPPFAGAGSNVPIKNHGALVSFADRPYVYFGVQREGPFVSMLTLETGQNLSTDNVALVVRDNVASPTPFTTWFVSDVLDPTKPPKLISQGPFNFSTSPCTPTFSQPCTINYLQRFDPDYALTINRQIDNLFF